MKKFRKYLSLLLALTLSVSASVSCSDKTNSSSSSDDNSSDMSAEATVAEADDNLTSSDAPAADHPRNIIYEDDDAVSQLSDRSAAHSSSSNKKRTRQAASSAKWNDLKSNPEKDLTIMVYMVGSDLESNGKAASRDIIEMCESGLTNKNVNLVVYTGGAKTWWINVPANCNNYLVYNGGGDFNIYSDQEKNMGEADTLSGFMNEVKSKYPAKDYALICWDHGGGPLMGYGLDELYKDPDGVIDTDHLTLDEMSSALSESGFNTKKLKFIGFDACLMSSIEVAEMCSNYAETLIASPETEPGSGWDYSCLNTLNSSTDISSLSKSIINYYADSLKASRSAMFNPDYTLYSLDLSQISNTRKALDSLFDKMSSGISEKEYNDIFRARTKVHEYSPGEGYDLVDLGDLAVQLKSIYPKESNALSNALDKLVTYGVSNVKSSTGISVYFPYEGYGMFSYYGENFLDQLSSSGYKEFMDTFTAPWKSGTASKSFDTGLEVSSMEQQPDNEGSFDYYQLTDEQLADFGSAYYTVFYRSKKNDDFFEDECYYPIMEKIPLVPDENGVLAIDLDPEIIIAVSEDDNNSGDMDSGADQIFARCVCSELGDNSNVYASRGNALSTDSIHFLYNQIIYTVFTIKAESGADKAVIKNVTSSPLGSGDESSDAISFNGKNDISGENMSSLMVYYVPVIWENNDYSVPYTELEKISGKFTLSVLNFDSSFFYKPRYISELDVTNEFWYQIIITDRSGKEHGTEIRQFPEYSKDFIEEFKTDSGEMQFSIFDDHAELISYYGTDKNITVPDKAGDKPVTVIRSCAFKDITSLKSVKLPETVTVIGDQAFSGCSTLEKINIPSGVTKLCDQVFLNDIALTSIDVPDTITEIDSYALSNTSITKFNIPASVEKIGINPFHGCIDIKLTIDPDNKYYTMDNNVLFDKNKKLLIAFFGQDRESYSVPEGVEEICPEAFSDSCTSPIFDNFDDKDKTDDTGAMHYVGLKKIKFPSSLKRIDNYAFYGIRSFTELDLPDSLEFIGANCFGRNIMYTDRSGMIIHIGPNVEYIGYSSFSSFSGLVFDVDKNNPYYSSVDGKLMNVNGTTEIEWFDYDGMLTEPHSF